MTVAKGSRRRLSRATAVGVPAACLSLVIAVFATFLMPAASSAAPSCPKVAVVMVPGTWETTPTASPHQATGMLKQITDPIAAKYGAAVQIIYTPYTADAFRKTTYGASKADGVRALNTQLSKITAACRAIKVAFGGFSQGADVAGDVASNIGNGKGPLEPDQVLAVALLADPKRGTAGEVGVGPQPVGTTGIAGPRQQGMGALAGQVATICAPAGPGRSADLYCGVDAKRDGLLASLGTILSQSGATPTGPTPDSTTSGPGTADELATSLTSNLDSEALGGISTTHADLTSAATPADGSVNPNQLAQTASTLVDTLSPLVDIATSVAGDPGLAQRLGSAPANSPEHAASTVLGAVNKADLSQAVGTARQLAQTAGQLSTSSLPANTPEAQQLTSTAKGLSNQIAPVAATPADTLTTASNVLAVLQPQVLVDQLTNVASGVGGMAANLPKIIANLQALPARIAAADIDGSHRIAGELNNLFRPLVAMAAQVDFKAASQVLAMIPDPYGYTQIAAMVLSIIGNVDIVRLANDIGQAQEVAWAALKNPTALAGLIPIGLDIASVASGMLTGTAAKTDPQLLGQPTEVSSQTATLIQGAQTKNLAGLAGSLTELATSSNASDLTKLVSQGLDAAAFFGSQSHVSYGNLTVDKHGRSATQWLADWINQRIATVVGGTSV